MNSVLIREHVTEEVYTPPQLVYNMQAEKRHNQKYSK